MRTVAFLIAASPTDAFYSQIAALRARIGAIQWRRWQPSLHVFVGGDRHSDPINAWMPYLPDVQIRWSSDAQFAEEGDWAQSDDAIRFAPCDADVLVALDADTFPICRVEPILDRVHETNAVAGVIAHYPTLLNDPRIGRHVESLRDAWTRLASGLTDVTLDFAYTHSLVAPDRPPDERLTPFYLNFGVVAFPRAAFSAVAERYLSFRPSLMKRMQNGDFSGQVALTLAIADARVRTWALPMRYNFPNDPTAEWLYPEEVNRVAIVHYLRTNEIDRHRVFTTPEDYASFVSRPLSGVNRILRDAVIETFGTVYPFARDAAPLRRHA